ncbi:expressed unknown protein (Partial), partial [Seminavis robusta]
DEALEDRRSSHHDRDIPLELTIPTNHRNPPQQEQLPQQQQEYSLNMNLDDMRNVNPNGEDRRHPDQLRLMKRQSKSRSLSPGHSPVNNNRRHTPHPAAAIVNEQQEFEPPPNLMRDLPHEYDAILTGGKDHRHGQPSPHRQSHRREDNRHYHPSQQEIVAHNGNHYPHPHHPPHHHARHPHHHEQGQPRTTYDQPPARLPAEPPARLQAPVEFVEFPVGWDGREIETTQDDELLDRDEDEYYRRRAAHRLREQQAQQQSLQSLQSQSLQSQSIQSQSRTSRQTPRPGPVRRAQSNVSNDSFLGAAGAGASDMYSQNVALSGRRAPMQMIEVSPGVSMPFRGSEETWEAIALNRIVRTECLGCSIQLYCVEDAELVVCPDCQTMSPAHKTEDPQAKRTGLGLGFKEEQLVQWRNAGP